jgi:hypothetical protein
MKLLVALGYLPRRSPGSHGIDIVAHSRVDKTTLLISVGGQGKRVPGELRKLREQANGLAGTPMVAIIDHRVWKFATTPDHKSFDTIPKALHHVYVCADTTSEFYNGCAACKCECHVEQTRMRLRK